MKITFVGDLTVDVYPELKKTQFGGSSLNCAVWAKRAGAKAVSVAAAVGSDEYGKQFYKRLRVKHLGIQGVRTITGKTSYIEVFIDPKTGEHRWGDWRPETLAHFHVTPKDWDRLKSEDAIVLVVYGPNKHLVPELVRFGKKEKKKPMIVINFGDLTQFRRSPVIAIDHIDGYDGGFFGLNYRTDASIIQRLRLLSERTNKLIVITLGSKGAIAYKGTQSYAVAAQKIPKVVNTTGAGDAFLSGFMIEYLKTGNLKRSLDQGNAFGGKAIKKIGAY